VSKGGGNISLQMRQRSMAHGRLSKMTAGPGLKIAKTTPCKVEMAGWQPLVLLAPEAVQELIRTDRNPV
jgi:hypothetical protein